MIVPTANKRVAASVDFFLALVQRPSYKTAVKQSRYLLRMPSSKSWQHWLERFYNLRRDKRVAHERPHKPVLLLAIFDLLDRGLVKQNEISLNQELVAAFKRYFAVVRQQDDRPTIENPFYHLSGDGFWKVIAKSDGTPLYEPGNASHAPNLTTLRNTHARFDDRLWSDFISHAQARHQLREAIIARYFPNQREQISAIAGSHLASPLNDYLREEPPGRDAAFRHTVLEIYDFRCAACGIRVKMSDNLSLVEAAHLIPFGVSRNDRPDNGMALCPNHHWAMDRFLIAPGPDPHCAKSAGVWRIASLLDARIEGQKDLVALANQPVIGPSEAKYYPALESLRWREKHLGVKY